MYNVIKNYIDGMSISNFNKIALNNDIVFSYEELSFAYEFIKNNWFIILSDIDNFNMESYKDKFSKENYDKISRLFNDLYNKYGILLNKKN